MGVHSLGETWVHNQYRLPCKVVGGKLTLCQTPCCLKRSAKIKNPRRFNHCRDALLSAIKSPAGSPGPFAKFAFWLRLGACSSFHKPAPAGLRNHHDMFLCGPRNHHREHSKYIYPLFSPWLYLCGLRAYPHARSPHRPQLVCLRAGLGEAFA